MKNSVKINVKILNIKLIIIEIFSIYCKIQNKFKKQ